MARKSSIIIGKAVRHASRLRGGGSALPGLVVEKIDKNFLRDHIANLPYGVVVISGTNGKTTTTKIVVELLEKQGLKVFTNRTGSNFVRGVIAAILESVTARGKLDADIAVLELDEAHATKFVDIIQPDYCLLLNVMRDQMCRFGNLDNVADLLTKIAKKTTKAVVTNREDSRLAKIDAEPKTYYFGLSDKMRPLFFKGAKVSRRKAANVILDDMSEQAAVFKIDRKEHSASLELKGVYNAFNAAAALSLVKVILPGTKNQKLVNGLTDIKSAFGRGESFNINDQSVELFLVKNPDGFQLALNSFGSDKFDTMIAINDSPADGQCIAWLGEVNFSRLKTIQVVSGTRASDVTEYLKRNKKTAQTTEPNLLLATEGLISLSDRPKRIFANYSAMLEIRRILNKHTDVDQAV